MTEHIYQNKGEFILENGQTINDIQIAYHTAGILNQKRNNVIWICHALTANSNVEEWWPNMVGDGLLFDTSKYFIICANVLGSCYGTTGPLSINSQTGDPYYHEFPLITIRDMVNIHELLRNQLGIKRIYELVGGSIGGFQALEYSIMYPEMIDHLIFIAASVQITPWATAFNQSQRLAIEADSTFAEERPYGGAAGLKSARSIALLSYRNVQTYNQTQKEKDLARTRKLKASGYQNHQGDKLVKRFDAYSYYNLTEVMDSHNVVRDRGSLGEALGRIKASVLSIGISSDLLFPVNEQKLLAHVTQGEYREIESGYGHDGFLLESEKLTKVIQEFWSANELEKSGETSEENHLTLEWSRSA